MILKIKILKKMKKTHGDIMILHLHIINDIMYHSCNMECNRQFFVILDHFLPSYLTNILENYNFEKMKKMFGEIIILKICTINDYHMMHDSWDMECNWHTFSSFKSIFCPFTTQKIKILKKWKKHLEILFYAWLP